MEYKLTIDGTLPNLNDYIQKLNINKFHGAKLKRETEEYISLFIKKQLRGVTITKPVTVDFTWIEPNMKRDKDNIASAKKFIFDALVANKIIRNDGWAHVKGFMDDFDVDAGKPRVEIIIREYAE